MYKVIEKETHDLFLGTEKAVIKMANDRLSDKDEDYLIDWSDNLKDAGVIVKIGNNGCYAEQIQDIETATKFLELDDYWVVDLGEILEYLKNNFCVLISQEE